MVDTGSEVDLWRLEGVVCGEVDGQEEDAALEWTVTLAKVSGNVICGDSSSTYGTHDGCLPVELSITSVCARFRTHPAFRSGRSKQGYQRLLHTRSSPMGPAEHDEGGSLHSICQSRTLRISHCLIEI